MEIAELRASLRRLEGRHPASPQARRDFLLFSIALEGLEAPAAEEEVVRKLPTRPVRSIARIKNDKRQQAAKAAKKSVKKRR